MYTPLLHPETDALKSVAHSLRQLVRVDAIYCFSFRSFSETNEHVLFATAKRSSTQHHFGLLVVAEDFPQNFIADASETIRQQTDGRILLTLLGYSLGAFRQEGAHQLLLYQIVSKGFRLYRRHSQRALLRFAVVPVRDVVHTERQWNSHRYMATCYREAESAVENPNGDSVQVVLLHAALEHLCLGLVYVFMGHRPSCFGIGYLLRLCGLFMPLAAELFPERTDEDKRLMKVLGLNCISLRHQPGLKVSITDVEVLRKRVCLFEAGALEMVGVEVASLRSQ